MPTDPTTLDLLNRFIQEYNAHLNTLAGTTDSDNYAFQPIAHDNAYAIVPLMAALGNGLQQAYPVTAGESNYSWEDGAACDFTAREVAAFNALLEATV